MMPTLRALSVGSVPVVVTTAFVRFVTVIATSESASLGSAHATAVEHLLALALMTIGRVRLHVSRGLAEPGFGFT